MVQLPKQFIPSPDAREWRFTKATRTLNELEVNGILDMFEKQWTDIRENYRREKTGFLAKGGMAALQHSNMMNYYGGQMDMIESICEAFRVLSLTTGYTRPN